MCKAWVDDGMLLLLRTITIVYIGVGYVGYQYIVYIGPSFMLFDGHRGIMRAPAYILLCFALLCFVHAVISQAVFSTLKPR